MEVVWDLRRKFLCCVNSVFNMLDTGTMRFDRFQVTQFLVCL